MTMKSGTINLYNAETNEKFTEIDADEAKAIEEYDYEQAQFLYNSRCVMQDAHINEAKNHYEQQLQNYKEKFADLLQRKQEENEEKFNHDCEEARQRLQKRIEELDASQKSELQELEQRWRKSRSQQQDQVNKTVQSLLSSSQLLAKSHRYQEAIDMRDKARSMQKRRRHPNIEECDKDFQEQFKQMLIRQEQAFNELLEQHHALIELYREKLEAANNTAEAECQIDEAYMSVEIMDTALLDTKNQDAAVAVVQHFSPRARKSGKKSFRNTSSLNLEEEEGE